MKSFIANYIISIFLISTSFSQQDSLFPVKTSKFDLTYDSLSNIIDPSSVYLQIHSKTSYIYGVRSVLSLNDTNLIIRKNSNSLKLNVNDINSVEFYHGTKFFEGMGTGALIGFVGVLLLHSLGNDSSFTGFATALGVGVVVAIPCAVIGGIAGLFFEDSQFYDLSGLSTEKKKAKLKKLIGKYKDS